MNVMRWLRTLIHLRPVQIYGRLWYKFYNPKPNLSPPPEPRLLTNDLAQPLSRERSLIDQFKFNFLNEIHTVASPEDWDNPNFSKLWRYNLHYFDDLNAMEAKTRRDWHKSIFQRWITENPPAKGTGWEPYPTSLRMINWIKWSLAGNDLPPNAIHSLAVQARWLTKRIEHHLLGNHLMSNAKALIFAGLFFKGAEADQWCKQGFSILNQQIPEQILADGAQFELSPMYHCLALEDMLDLMNICAAYEKSLSPQLKKTIEQWPDEIKRMHQWLVAMNHPDGEISFFNDATFGIAPNLAELEKYAAKLDIKLQRPILTKITHLEPSGYLRIDQQNSVAILDVGPIGPNYLPAHAHADTLSFEVSLFGQRVVVNSGISQYGISQQRNLQRGTSAHNTVVINGKDSSEVWAGFRVGRRAYPKLSEILEEPTQIKITASHNGYRWLPGKNIHQRTWCFKPETMTIKDEISGAFNDAKMFLYFHPEVKITGHPDDENSVFLTVKDKKCILQVVGGVIQLRESNWYSQFGKSTTNSSLIVRFLSPNLKTTISWDATT